MTGCPWACIAALTLPSTRLPIIFIIGFTPPENCYGIGYCIIGYYCGIIICCTFSTFMY